MPILAIVLLVGIVAEARRSVLSPVVNLAPYVVWLIVALWERANVAAEAAPQELYFGKVLLVLPLAVVIAVDLIFISLHSAGGKLGSEILVRLARFSAISIG